MAAYQQLANTFLQHYYTTFDQNRAELVNLYGDDSFLSFEGEQSFGRDAIMTKLTSLPFKVVQHVFTTVDAQPLRDVDANQAIMIAVMGQLKTDDDPPHSFFQSFVLRIRSGKDYYIGNEVFRLVLHEG